MKKSFLCLLTLSALLLFGCSGDKMQMLRQLEQEIPSFPKVLEKTFAENLRERGW